MILTAYLIVLRSQSNLNENITLQGQVSHRCFVQQSCNRPHSEVGPRISDQRQGHSRGRGCCPFSLPAFRAHKVSQTLTLEAKASVKIFLKAAG